MTIYLYKKTHNITGLKYLGQTVSADPHKYRGSGKRWLPHIKKHGYDVTTEILKECRTYEELKEWGLYYSNLWDVANSDDWANLKPEEGDGGWGSEFNPQKRPEIRKKTSIGMKKFLADNPEIREARKQWRKEYWTDEKKKEHKYGGMGTVTVTDMNGNSLRITKEEYDNIDRTLPVEQQQYVNVASKESKRRKHSNTLRIVT